MKMEHLLEDSKIGNTQTPRNKELTKLLILDAAREIISVEGIKKLGINKLAKAAGRSKRMIYDYFGGIEGVVYILVKETDHWLSYEDKIAETVSVIKEDQGREFISVAMKQHFYKFNSDPVLQELGLLVLSSEHSFFNELARKKEHLADQLWEISDKYFKNTNVHFRAVCALLFGGINYMVLHSKTRKTPYCGIDINNFDHRAKLMKTIEHITNCVYDSVQKD